MYGYLRYKTGNKPDKISRMYKCYYCSLCHALKKNYGIFTTALLSYDMVFAAISLSSANNYVDEHPKCCLYKRKKRISDEYKSDYWNGIATACVALAYSKVFDNYLDKQDLLSKIMLGMFTLFSRKARRGNPEIFEYLETSMLNLKSAEEKMCGFNIQSTMSAEMISSALCNFGNISNLLRNKEFLYAVALWLCFVDAIDDYEKDCKKKTYNPLCSLWRNDYDTCQGDLNCLIGINYSEISKIYSDILTKLNVSLKEIKVNAKERAFLEDMIHRVMPRKVGFIFLKKV